MKHTLLLFTVASLILASCSTAYKAAQTPDDVYYSPTKVRVDEPVVAKRDRYQENISSQDDRFLRMKVQDPNRWGTIDDYNYWYDSRYDYNAYNYNSNIYLNNRYAWNNWGYNTFSYGGGYYYPNYYGYNGYYSAVYPVIYYKNPKVYTGVTGKSNLSTFLNTRYSNQNNSPYKNNQAGNNFGNLVKRVFTTPNGSNGNTSNSYDRPARTIEPSSTPSSSAGGRSGGYSSTGSSTSTPRPPRN